MDKHSVGRGERGGGRGEGGVLQTPLRVHIRVLKRLNHKEQ